jgi:hypothetical protein
MATYNKIARNGLPEHPAGKLLPFQDEATIVM